MGFDNEYILNIQSLPGEYFCPVCRTLVYPNEALQTQCTHLYCKPCLAYVVATTKACPYDGYLVTETDSKPLVESNKLLAETIGKVTVHCLYNKSGCQWQGTLSAGITHGSTCAYGNSPVVCNRCGTQIVHRQVQEHAQLCPGMQSQTQQADGSQVQPSIATAQAVITDPSLVSSAGSAAVADTTVPSATAAVTASSVATGGAAGATTIAAPPSCAGASASAPQTATAEQWYQQQMQYSQHYQQQYAGYNPYTQQYQQYGQYQQAYQQYTQPQMQAASQNVVQASAQPAQVLQSSQPQLQAPTGHPQTQQHQVQSQPQSQPNLPYLQAPAGQTQPQQPMQSAYQVPPMQQQSQVPLQLPAPQAQPTVHQPASTQVGNKQFGVPSTQATQHQVQPPVQAQPPQLTALPPQQNQNLQPHMQLNSQIQHQPPQVQLQSYQQSQAYPQPTPLMHPRNTSYPQQQMPSGAPQHPVHASRQQGLVSQHPAPMRPPLPSQQPAMLPPQGIPHTPQHQQNVGYHAQRPPMHSSIPSQAPQQGLPPHSSVPSQAGQPQKNNFVSGSKDGQTVVALDSADTSIGKDGIASQGGNCQGSGVHGGKEHKASDTFNNLEKGGSAQQASQRNARPPGAFAPLGTGSQHPFGPDRIFPQHMMNSGAMPYNMQGQPNQTSRPPKHSLGDNIRPPLEQPYVSFNSGMEQRTFVENHIPSPMPQPAGIRPGEGMVRSPLDGLRSPLDGPFPVHHDTMPPFVPEPLGRPHPPGMSKSNGVGGGPFVSGRAFHQEGFNTPGEHARSFAAYPGRQSVHHKDIEDLKQYPGPAHLDVQGLRMGPNSFERTLGRPDGFPERPGFENQKGQFPVALHDDFSRKPNATGRPDFLSPGAEFDHHGSDRMPNLMNPGPFFQGRSAGPGGVHKDYLGSVNAFDGPVFPYTRFHPGHMHPDGPNLVADYSLHGFPKEPGHFGLSGVMRNACTGWCRICLFNCGSAENLDLHVETREHQQCAMDLILKMKQDVAKRQKLNLGGPKSFHNKKVAGKVHFRGNRR